MKIQSTALILLAILTTVNGAIADHGAAQQRSELPLTSLANECKSPKAKLYKSTDDFSPLKFTIISDFNRLNPAEKYARGDATVGVLRVDSPNSKKIQVIPVVLSNRGNSRGSSCEFRPLRISFVDTAMAQKIESELAAAGHTAKDSAEYVTRYFNILKTMDIDFRASAKAPKGSLFANLGDDIKLVTHCGKAHWDQLGGQTPEEQNSRLLGEYYIYKMLAKIRTTVEEVQLAEITYLNPDGSTRFSDIAPDGTTTHAKLAFFREPPRSVMKRCQLENPSKEVLAQAAVNIDADYRLTDTTSKFVSTFLHRFTCNYDYGMDGHNTNVFMTEDKKARFYGPYDFDLSCILLDGYAKNPESLQSNTKKFARWLDEQDRSLSLEVAKKVLSKKNEIQNVLDQSKLNSQLKGRLQEWFTTHMGLLEEFTNKDQRD